ncbi:CAP domain-containing protein [Streptomyces sp. NPDC006487]|uniref:CAP domain-containing protein n=1 Tax=Streptomyces sp. NPDC006487 TaxID=3364748 RepID=UPI0036967FA4
MGRHKTPAAKGTHVLPTGSRLVACVAAAAAGAGALAAALIPAGGSPGLHDVWAHSAPAAAVRQGPTGAGHAAEAAPPAAPGAAAPRSPSAAPSGTAPRANASTTAKNSAAPLSPAAQIAHATALQKKLDSFSPAEVLTLVNQTRQLAGAGPLKLDRTLQTQAEQAVVALPDQNAQAGPVTGTPVQRSGATDADAVNVSRNEVGAQAAVNGWLKDPAERANLLNPDFHTMGVASSNRPNVIWWAQLFGR